MNSGWEIKTLGEICEKGSSNVSRNQLDKELGKYPIYGASGFIMNVSFFHQDKDYISIVKDGAGVGRLSLQNAYSSVIGTSQYILPKKGIDIKYLYYALSGVDFRKYFSGATIPHIYFSDYCKEKIGVPSLPEQKRIVSILDEAFAAIATAQVNAKKNLENSNALFESFLRNIFVNPKNNWEIKKWGEICKFVRGPFGGSLKKGIFKNKGYAVYEQKHAIHNHFKQLRYFIDEKKFEEMKRFELKAGDIIMSCSGVTLGRVALVPENIEPGIINQALLKLTPTKDVSAQFLKHWLRSQVFQNIIKKFSKGAAIPNVPAANILKEIQIPLPPLREQELIVDSIDSFYVKSKKLESIYTDKSNDLENIKKSILQKSFAGELRGAQS